MSQLFYCSDCFHIYYQLPPNKKCAICKNELTEKDIIGNQDLLTCETCHYIYTPNSYDSLIPHEIENPNFLCACINRCPTNSELSVGKQEYFIGNIVLAKQYRCSNCGAISLRNPETQLKECADCGSKYVFVFQTDPTKFHYFYQCINPNHGIRLKFRDLLDNVNAIIQNEINRIIPLQEGLKQQYQAKISQLREEFAQKRILDRIQQKLMKSPSYEKRIDEVNQWANDERLKLYQHFRPISLRCAVQQNPHEGCGALGQIYSQKMVAEVQETMMKKTTTKEIQEIEIPVVRVGKTGMDDSLISSAYPLQVKRPNLDTSSSHLKSYFTSQALDKIYHLESSPYLLKSLPVFAKLPDPKENELFFLFQLDQFDTSSQNFIPVNHGVLLLKILRDNQPIRFGRQEFLRIQWKSPHLLAEYPFIWDTITPNSNISCQFFIEKQEKEFLISQGEKAISPLYRLMPDSIFSEWIGCENSITIAKNLCLMLKLFQSFDHPLNKILFYRILVGFNFRSEISYDVTDKNTIAVINESN